MASRRPPSPHHVVLSDGSKIQSCHPELKVYEDMEAKGNDLTREQLQAAADKAARIQREKVAVLSAEDFELDREQKPMNNDTTVLKVDQGRKKEDGSTATLAGAVTKEH